MAVAAAPSCNRWMQRAVEESAELQYGTLPWLSQKLTLPVDMRTRWLVDQQTAAAAGVYKYTQRLCNACCGVGCLGLRLRHIVTSYFAGHACLNLEAPESISLDNQQIHSLLSACLGKDRCQATTHTSCVIMTLHSSQSMTTKFAAAWRSMCLS